MLGLLLEDARATLLRAPSQSIPISLRLRSARPAGSRTALPNQNRSPSRRPAEAPATEAEQTLVPAPTEKVAPPCLALPVAAAPISGPPAAPAPAAAIHPQKPKANSEEVAPRRERKTEATPGRRSPSRREQ